MIPSAMAVQPATPRAMTGAAGVIRGPSDHDEWTSGCQNCHRCPTPRGRVAARYRGGPMSTPTPPPPRQPDEWPGRQTGPVPQQGPVPPPAGPPSGGPLPGGQPSGGRPSGEPLPGGPVPGGSYGRAPYAGPPPPGQAPGGPPQW